MNRISTRTLTLTTELFRFVQSYVLPLFVIIPREGYTKSSLTDETLYQLGLCIDSAHLSERSGKTTQNDSQTPFITLEGLFPSIDSVFFFIGHITNVILSAQVKDTEYPLQLFILDEGEFLRYTLRVGNFNETTDRPEDIPSLSLLHTVKTFYQSRSESNSVDVLSDKGKVAQKKEKKGRKRRKEERRRDFYLVEFTNSVASLEASIQEATHIFRCAQLAAPA